MVGANPDELFNQRRYLDLTAARQSGGFCGRRAVSVEPNAAFGGRVSDDGGSFSVPNAGSWARQGVRGLGRRLWKSADAAFRVVTAAAANWQAPATWHRPESLDVDRVNLLA